MMGFEGKRKPVMVKFGVGLGVFDPRMRYRGTLRPRRCAAEVESIREKNFEAHRRSRECQVRFAQVKETSGWLIRRQWAR